MLYRDDEEYITLFGIITYDFKESDVIRNKEGKIIKWLTKESDISNSDIYDILTNRSTFATNNHYTKEQVKAIVNNKRRSGYCKSYIKAIRDGDLQSSVPFKQYEETILRARKKLIGFKIFDNKYIKEVVNHIAERIIGDGKDRLPINTNTIKECLRDSDTKIRIKSNGDIVYTNKKGIIFFNENYKLMTVVGRGQKW